MLTVENAEEYIKLVKEFCLYTGIQRQVDAFKGNEFYRSSIEAVTLLDCLFKPWDCVRVQDRFGLLLFQKEGAATPRLDWFRVLNSKKYFKPVLSAVLSLNPVTISNWSIHLGTRQMQHTSGTRPGSPQAVTLKRMLSALL